MRSVSFLATLVVATLTAWQAFALDIGPPAPGSACDVETRKFLAPTGGIGLRVAVAMNWERDGSRIHWIPDQFAGEVPAGFNLAMFNDKLVHPDDMASRWAFYKSEGMAWAVVRSDYVGQIFIPNGAKCVDLFRYPPSLDPADFPSNDVGSVDSVQPPKG